MNEQSDPLSFDHRYRSIFKKLSNTIKKYRNLLPDIADVEEAIMVNALNDDGVHITRRILRLLGAHAQKSKIVLEVCINILQDLGHVLEPDKYPKHQGKYYIDSVADD